MAAALPATSLNPTPKFSNAEINNLFQNLFDDSDPDNAGRSKNGGDVPSEEEVASCLDQLVPNLHSPSETQVPSTPDTSADSAFDSLLLTSASSSSSKRLQSSSSSPSSSFTRPPVPIFYQDESDDEVILAPPPKADLDLAMDVDECGGGGNSYELLVDDGFVYDQGFNSDDDHEEEDGEQVEGAADKKEEQPWLFLEESYEDEDDKDKDAE